MEHVRKICKPNTRRAREIWRKLHAYYCERSLYVCISNGHFKDVLKDSSSLSSALLVWTGNQCLSMKETDGIKGATASPKWGKSLSPITNNAAEPHPIKKYGQPIERREDWRRNKQTEYSNHFSKQSCILCIPVVGDWMNFEPTDNQIIF